MLRFSSLSTLALCLAACGSTVTDATGGGGGSGGTSTSSSTSTSGGGQGAGGSGNACASAGGACVAIVPDTCMNGTWGDASMYPCGGDGVGCCFEASCGAVPCNDVGTVRCIAGAVETCTVDPGSNCAPAWAITEPCGASGTCSSDGTKCVPSPATTCSASADCGCGCGCVNGACQCTGGLPPSCSSDLECGPECSGFQCIGGQCAPPACQPGLDQTCNEDLAMSSFAGACNADATCTCKPGFTKQASGKCG